MPPLKLAPTLVATSDLFVGEESSPLPMLVATTRAFPRKNLADQGAAFAAVVTRSVAAALKGSPGLPPNLNILDCIQEHPTKSTMHGFLLAKLTIVNPVLLDSLTKLTDSSPLLPIQQPNPGFDEIRLSWENHTGKYYRTLLNVPKSMSAKELARLINDSLPCKYVKAQTGPGGCTVIGQHVVEFTVSSATDIPAEIIVPNPNTGHKPFIIRVVHVPIVDHKMAINFSRVPLSDWQDTPTPPAWQTGNSGSPSLFKGPGANRQNQSTSMKANTQKVIGSKNAKTTKTPQLDQVAQQRVTASLAKVKELQNQIARDEKAAAEALRAKRVAEAAASFAAAKDAATARQHVKNFLQKIVQTAIDKETIALRQGNKRNHESSGDEASGEEDDDDRMPDPRSNTSKTDPKKAKDAGHVSGLTTTKLVTLGYEDMQVE